MFEIFRDNISGEKTFWAEAFFGIRLEMILKRLSVFF